MTTEPAPAVGAALAALRPAPAPFWPARLWRRAGPLATISAALLLAWYLGAIWLNAPQIIERLDGIGSPWSAGDLVQAAWAMERPVLPAPHQIAVNWFDSVFGNEIDSPRSLVFHAWVTLQATLLGFGFGVLLGVVLAIGVVYSRVLDRSLLPWVIASQTIPILALAPMVVVVLGSLGYPTLVSKAVISMYLCFFPITIGMVKGLRSPEVLQLDLMRTYSASGAQVLRLLRLPAALPFLFASAKVGIAASLVGAIVGELPTGAQAGLGARLLSGSYFGQTIQIWSALVMASLLGVALVSAMALFERGVSRAMGLRP